MQQMSITRSLLRIFEVIPHRRRWQGMVIVGLMLLGAMAELLTLGAVLPFLALVADPEGSRRYPLVGEFVALLGLTDRFQILLAIAGLFCVIAVVAAIIRLTLVWASQKFVFRVGYDLGVSLYQRMLYQPYSFHVSQNSSTIISGVGKVQQVLNQMLLPVMQGLTSILIALFILGGLLLVNARVALISAAAFGSIYLAVSLATRARLRRNSKIISRTSTQRLKTVQEGLGGIRDVLIDQSQPVYLGKFAEIDTELREAQATNALIGATPRFVIEGAGMVLIALLALVLSREPGGFTAALPVLGALALGAQRLIPLLQQMYDGWTKLMSGRATFESVMALLERPLPADLRSRHAAVPMPFERTLALSALEFRYADDAAPVLRDIEIEIAKGSRIGFVGKTGSGKSTLTDIVMGLLKPTGGTVSVDGRVLDDANVISWQLQVAHVPQHIYLSDATVRENIAFGVPRDRIDDERVREVARKADIGQFIEEQPRGYDTVVGERGVRLSGGQRQRIGIARALYKQSALLILDEATSALDDATEASVMAAVDRLGRDLTVIMVAHRLTTLRNCDVIYRLDRGRIVDRGRYDEVIAPMDLQTALG